MKASEAKLSNLIGHAEKQFIIPIYQRSYKWTKQNVDRLWEDITEIDFDVPTNMHFLDSIVYSKLSHINMASSMGHRIEKYQVIDGQQRLTTVSLLLISIRDRLIFFTERQEAERLNNLFIINLYAKEYDDKVRLKLSDTDHIVYKKLVFNDTLTLDDKKAIIFKNFNVLKKYVAELSLEELRKLIRKFEDRLDIIDTFLEANDNPQKIFSSLNSTGKELKASDLVKNYILMNLDSSVQIEFYNRFWIDIEKKLQNEENTLMNFLQHYLTMKIENGTVVTTSSIYDTFEKYYSMQKSQHSHLTDKDFIEILLRNISEYAEVYKKLFLDFHVVNFDSMKNSMRKLGIESYYPLIMKIEYECYTETESVLKVIENYLVRRFVVGLQAGKTKNVFAKMVKNLEITQSSTGLAQNVQELLKLEQKQNRYPNDNEFTDSLKHSPIYANSSTGTKYLLYKIEHFRNSQNRTLTVNFEDLTVEHILPQTEYSNLDICWTDSFDLGEYEKYVHTLGNLTLVTQEKNSQLGNRCYGTKKDIYKTDSFIGTKDIDNTYNEWEASSIAEHANKLISDFVLEIWR